MTRFSEDFHKQMLYDAEHPGNILSALRDGHVQGLEAWKEIMTHEISGILRGAKPRFAGGAAWENGRVAVEDTGMYMQNKIFQFLLLGILHGFTVGRYKHEPEADNADWEKCIRENEPNYVELAEINAEMISKDPDLPAVLGERVADCVVGFCTKTGFDRHTGKETVHVWDIWRATMGATGIGVFHAAQKVGEKWREEAILEGIMSATES